MAIKKYTNGSWVPASFHKYGTETDTITTLPATVIGDGTPISSYTIKGNMEQSGTPTPSSPIYPSECGKRTENLFDGSTLQSGYYGTGNSDYSVFTSDDRYRGFKLSLTAGTYTLNITCNVSIRLLRVSNSIDGVATVVTDDRPYTFTLTGDATIYVSFRNQTTTNNYPNLKVMVNVGSTSLPYEPYGYKLPLTLGSTTTDIYLGEVQSTRKIKKLVLTGEESWILNLSYYQYSFDLNSKPKSRNSLSISSHFYIDERLNVSTYRFGGSQQNPEAILLINYDGAVGGVDAFKQFLAAQYAAGTPVTIWYVLAEPTTGIVNEPLRKIGDYVDSVSGSGLATSGTGQAFDINTTLKPSEVDMTYHGWHEHDNTKYST